MSDLHLEFHLRPATGHSGPGYQVFDFPVGANNLALLGNIGLTTQAGLFDFFHRQLLRFENIFFLLGNHEGYNSTYEAAREKIHEFLRWINDRRASGEQLGSFIFMDRTRYDITDRVTILGCTLWSYVPSSHAAEVMRAGLNDFRRVDNWTPEDYRAAHLTDVEWLNETCRNLRENEPDREVVIFTHHGPTTKGTLKPEHENTELSCAFVTEMSLQPCWSRPVKLWAFGHTHKCVDFLRDGVRVVSNQRGYEGFEAAKSEFQPQKVVTV
ncbi:hypothetical protein K439DRAFT_1649058 [Ramaria rubella]|nr:hypothetical protein K439DRAFT_1649058 [Ramaria rubella]